MPLHTETCRCFRCSPINRAAPHPSTCRCLRCQKPTGPAHPRWKGGFPKCEICQKTLNNRSAKRCVKHMSDEHRRKLRIAKIGITGDQSNGWKGDAVSYGGLHRWIRRTLGTPNRCSQCGRTGFTSHQIGWANKSRQYKRKTSDWIRLCVRCHGAYDRGHRRKLKTKS